MKRWLLLFVALMGPGIAAKAQSPSTKPTAAREAAPVSRGVKGQVLISKETPPVRIEFDRAFKYVGGQSFVLYDVANAEQHFFVDADKQGHIKRLYWVQFEGYLPSNSHTYNYDSKNVVRIGGLDFIADSQARRIPPPAADAATRPANQLSDGDRGRAFLASKGFSLASNEVLWQRLLHMVDASKRNELMIIYLEDLSGMGLTAADLSEGGRAVAQWESVSRGLLARARKGMTITRR